LALARTAKEGVIYCFFFAFARGLFPFLALVFLGFISSCGLGFIRTKAPIVSFVFSISG
jgi:hypothetical protein